jgi:hypothetical protein
MPEMAHVSLQEKLPFITATSVSLKAMEEYVLLKKSALAICDKTAQALKI